MFTLTRSQCVNFLFCLSYFLKRNLKRYFFNSIVMPTPKKETPKKETPKKAPVVEESFAKKEEAPKQSAPPPKAPEAPKFAGESPGNVYLF